MGDDVDVDGAVHRVMGADRVPAQVRSLTFGHVDDGGPDVLPGAVGQGEDCSRAGQKQAEVLVGADAPELGELVRHEGDATRPAAEVAHGRHGHLELRVPLAVDRRRHGEPGVGGGGLHGDAVEDGHDRSRFLR